MPLPSISMTDTSSTFTLPVSSDATLPVDTTSSVPPNSNDVVNPHQSSGLSLSVGQDHGVNTPAISSQSEISHRLIARELSLLKENISDLKSELYTLKSMPSSLPVTDSHTSDIIVIKAQGKLLHNRIDSLKPPTSSEGNHSVTSTEVPPPNPSVTVTSWNCRGISSALPYLYHLLKNGSDIVAISEHWLWPFSIRRLSDLHPDYDGFGCCDNRLSEDSSLTKGCGGVGFIWKSP